MKFFAGILVTLLVYAVSIGMVWWWAWMVNPDLTSGTVWFVGGVVGIVCKFVEGVTRA